jgi:hypothetical protein
VHFALEVLVVKVQGVDDFGRASRTGFAYAGKNGTDDLFAEDEQAGKGANSQGINAVGPGVSDSLNELLASELAQVIGSLASGVRQRGAGGQQVDFLGEVFGGEAAGHGRQRDNRLALRAQRSTHS